MKRRSIADAAFSLYLSEGPLVNLERVAEVAGVSKVTIYNHFQSKDALLIEVVRLELLRAHSETERYLATQFRDAATAEEALERLSRAWLKGLTSTRLMQLRAMVIGQAKRVPQLGEAWMEYGPRRLHKHIGTVLVELAQKFQLEIPDIELAVLHLAGLVISPHVMYGTFHGEPDEETTDRLIKSALQMFLARYSKG